MMDKNTKFERRMFELTILSFCAFILAAVYFSQEPFCIPSQVVKNIDTQFGSQVFSCNDRKKAPLFGYLFEQKSLVEKSLQIEKKLSRLHPFQQTLSIHVTSELRQSIYQSTSSGSHNNLIISKKVFESKGFLERQIVKTWLRGLNKDYFDQELLAQEIFADFVLAIVSGRFSLEDPFSSKYLSIENQKWPGVLKSATAYCKSEWIIPDHFQLCRSIQHNEGPLSYEMNEFSIRPLVSSMWINMFSRLDLHEKAELTLSLVKVIQNLKPNDENLFDYFKSTPENPFLGPFLLVQRLNSVWTHSAFAITVPTYRNLLASLAIEINKSGFMRMIDVVEYDLVYFSDESLSSQSSRVKSMAELAKKYSQLRILIMDSTKIWFLPSIEPVSSQLLRKVRSRKMVLESCRKIDFARILGFSSLTEKLMVVRNCDLKKANNYQGYMASGAQGFAIQNQKSSFVQFHLPSLLLRKDQLDKETDVFKLIGQRQVDNPSFQSLGWTEVDWNEKLKTFQPKGYVDAIEIFRVFPQDESSAVSNL